MKVVVPMHSLYLYWSKIEKLVKIAENENANYRILSDGDTMSKNLHNLTNLSLKNN